jgi:hypothetical protein
LDEYHPGCGRGRRSADTAGRPSYDQAQGLRGAPADPAGCGGPRPRRPAATPCSQPTATRTVGVPAFPARPIPGSGPDLPQDDLLNADPTAPGSPATAVAGHLHALSALITRAEPADAAGLLSGVLAEGGVLDAVRGLLNTAVDFVDDRAQATGQYANRSLYTLWHILSLSADVLDGQAAEQHRAPQLLQELGSPGRPADGQPAGARGRHEPQDWVPPAAIRDAPAALDAISARLDGGTTPITAALLMGPVLDPDGGVLERLSAMLASASRYARHHGADPALWQDLGRASQHLDDISETLADSIAGLAQLPDATGPARGPGEPPRLPAPAAGAAPGRRR